MFQNAKKLCFSTSKLVADVLQLIVLFRNTLFYNVRRVKINAHQFTVYPQCNIIKYLLLFIYVSISLFKCMVVAIACIQGVYILAKMQFFKYVPCYTFDITMQI